MSDLPRLRANAAVSQFLSGRDWANQTPAQRRIVEGFLRLATTRGFESVTMRTLGREVGMKAPSIYSSFPGGKEEIVAEALRWFTHSFAYDLLAGVEKATSADEYWAALVQCHLTQQLERPEPGLWDLLVAADKVARFLDDEVRADADRWVRLHEDMYIAAAEEMGFELSIQTVQVILTLLDGAKRWVGNGESLVELGVRTVRLTHAILEGSNHGRSPLPLVSQGGTAPGRSTSIL